MKVRRPRKTNFGSTLSPRQERQADDAERRFDPLFGRAHADLSALLQEGCSVKSKRWRGSYLAAIYGIMDELLAERTIEQLKEDFYLVVAKESNNYERRNPFSLAIQAFETEYDHGISKGSRAEYANALTYAWSHSVPQPLVWGFILQVGGLKVADRKAKLKGTMEPWAKPKPPWGELQPIV